MRIPDPKANTTTEAYLAYKAGYLEQSELKPKLYEPYLHFDAWLAYWAGLTDTYPVSGYGKNLISPTPYISNTNVYSPEAGSKINHTYADYVTYELSNGTLSVTTDRQWGGVMMVSPALETGNYHISLTVTTGTSNNGRCRLQILDADHQVIENADYSSIAENSSKNMSWDITLSAGAKFIGVGVATSSSSGGNFTVSSLQLEAGSSATTYEPYSPIPEMLTDEEALVAYLSGVTNTYPEEIKDPYDVRITGYLRYLVSARFGRPDYPVNNEEFYLSNMKPPVVTNDTPSSSIELDDTAEAPFIDVKAYGDTSQTTYTGKNLFNTNTPGAGNVAVATGLNSIYLEKPDERTGSWYFSPRLPAGTYTLSYKVRKNSLNTDGIRSNVNAMKEDGTGTMQVASSPAYDGNVSYSFTATTEISHIYWYVYNGLENGAGADVYDIQVEAGSTATAFEPYVGGIRSPNPDYPQAVDTVTGIQVVNVEGKNLFDNNATPTAKFNDSSLGVTPLETGVRLTSNASVSYSGVVYIIGKKQEYIGKTLTFTTHSKSSSTNNSRVYIGTCNSDGGNRTTKANGAGDSGEYDLSVSWQVIDDDSNEYICITLYTTASVSITAGVYMDYTFAQLEIGSPATTFTQYKAPSSYEINLDGKNLWGGYTEYSRTSSGVDFEVKSDGSLTAEGIASATAYSITGQVAQSNGTYITLPAGTYYLSSLETLPVGVSLQIVETSASSTIRDGIGSFTLSGTTNVCARLRLTSGTNLTDGITIHPQIEIGSTATSYEPYHTPLELCKIGDYQDYIYQDADGDWYVHKEISNKYSFTGSEHWVSSTYGTNTWNCNQILITKTEGNKVLALCDIFYGVSSDNRSTSGDNITYCSQDNTIWVRNTTLASETAVQEATIGHYVYSVLATSTETLITDNNLISQLNALKEGGSYTGKTYITVTSNAPNLPALLKVEAGEYR